MALRISKRIQFAYDIRGEYGNADRIAISNTFTECNHIRINIVVLIAKPFTCAAYSSGNFICNYITLIFLYDSDYFLDKRFGGKIHATGSTPGFKNKFSYVCRYFFKLLLMKSANKTIGAIFAILPLKTVPPMFSVSE